MSATKKPESQVDEAVRTIDSLIVAAKMAQRFGGETDGDNFTLHNVVSLEVPPSPSMPPGAHVSSIGGFYYGLEFPKWAQPEDTVKHSYMSLYPATRRNVTRFLRRTNAWLQFQAAEQAGDHLAAFKAGLNMLPFNIHDQDYSGYRWWNRNSSTWIEPPSDDHPTEFRVGEFITVYVDHDEFQGYEGDDGEVEGFGTAFQAFAHFVPLYRKNHRGIYT
jgi:hypothetical protein